MLRFFHFFNKLFKNLQGFAFILFIVCACLMPIHIMVAPITVAISYAMVNDVLGLIFFTNTRADRRRRYSLSTSKFCTT